MSRRRRVLFSMLAILLALGCCDTVMRVVAHLCYRPAYDPFVHDPELGVVHRANSSGLATPKGTAPHPVSFGNLGQRGSRDVALTKRPDSIRIVVLGGSTTESLYVEDGRTWPELLERNLRTNYQTDRIEVINMGVSGYTTPNSIKALRRDVARLKPDLVLVHQGINDLMYFMKSMHPEMRLDRRFVPYYDREYGVLERWLCKSILFDRMNKLFYVFRFQNDTLSNLSVACSREYMANTNRLSIDFEGATVRAEAALHELAELARCHRFDVVLCSQVSLVNDVLPTNDFTHVYELTGQKCGRSVITWESLAEGLKLYRDLFERFADEHGFEFVDTMALVPKDKTLFIDHTHTTAKGDEAIANALADYFRASKLLDSE